LSGNLTNQALLRFFNYHRAIKEVLEGMNNQYKVARLDLSTHESVSHPAWSQIESAIRGLDGARNSLITLAIGETVPHMAIGGGPDRYIVYITFDNKSFSTLADPALGPGTIELVAGGQRGKYQKKNAVSLAFALQAAKVFALSGTLDSDLTWDNK
jgi:hypothetical protein